MKSKNLIQPDSFIADIVILEDLDSWIIKHYSRLSLKVLRNILMSRLVYFLLSLQYSLVHTVIEDIGLNYIKFIKKDNRKYTLFHKNVNWKGYYQLFLHVLILF